MASRKLHSVQNGPQDDAGTVRGNSKKVMPLKGLIINLLSGIPVQVDLGVDPYLGECCVGNINLSHQCCVMLHHYGKLDTDQWQYGFID